VTDEDRKKCFDAGMDAFLPKPVRKDRLLETIVQFINGPDDGAKGAGLGIS
jgi:CheY-like chemotaxis protein